MATITSIFKRYEKKYLLNENQYDTLSKILKDRFVPDEFGRSTIMNIYFDTKENILVQRSIDKPIYKEKLRLRTYGVPNDESNAFIEIKKKFKGVVYKRRVKMSYIDAYNYLVNGENPSKNSQIVKEIDWFLTFYKNIIPAMMISYERVALFCKENKDLRITFDTNIRWRRDNLDLRIGPDGNELLEPDQCLMEIKIPGAMPVWLSKILSLLEIYPISFSKYGMAYLTEICNTRKFSMDILNPKTNKREVESIYNKLI